jgi:hypothetical protein
MLQRGLAGILRKHASTNGEPLTINGLGAAVKLATGASWNAK